MQHRRNPREMRTRDFQRLRDTVAVRRDVAPAIVIHSRYAQALEAPVRPERINRTLPDYLLGIALLRRPERTVVVNAEAVVKIVRLAAQQLYRSSELQSHLARRESQVVPRYFVDVAISV